MYITKHFNVTKLKGHTRPITTDVKKKKIQALKADDVQLSSMLLQISQNIY
jgi:hypothetical protein